MNVQELEKQVGALATKREAARAAALGQASSEKIEALTKQAVDFMHAGKADKAKAVFAERDALKDQRDAEVRALGEQLSEARRLLRTEDDREHANVLEKKSIEELETMRAQLTDERKRLKRKLRIVVTALTKKQAMKAMQALWATLTPDERALLLVEAESK